MTTAPIDRLMARVIKGPRPDDCWLWTGALGDDGYGRIWVFQDGRQKAVRPHRLSYEATTGETLSRDVVLMHKCDVPLCVRIDPKHVQAGTTLLNNLDRSAKRRHANAHTNPWRGNSRQNLAQRSRALRAALLEHGWDEAIIRPLMQGHSPDQLMLW